LWDAQMTGTIIASAWSWTSVSDHQVPMWITLYIRRLSESHGAPAQNWGAPEIWDVRNGTVHIWQYHCSIMFRRYVNNVHANHHGQARNPVERGPFAGHLLIRMIWCWSCPVHNTDVNLSTFLFIGYMIEPVECRLLTEMDAMGSIVLGTCNACCTI
jgi:hypothetical protein